jgi:hypothetical protein
MLNSFKVPFKNTLDLLQSFQKIQKFKTECKEITLHNKNAEFWYDSDKNRFKIGIASHQFCSQDIRESVVSTDVDLKIQNNEISATLNFSKSFFGWTMPVHRGEIDLDNTNFIIFDLLQFHLKLSKTSCSSAKRQRCIIHKIDSKVSFLPSNYFKLEHHYLDLEDIKCGNSGGALELSMFGNVFTIFYHNEYLIIDTLNYIGEEYADIVESILLALAFLTGEYLMDDKYIIDYDDDNFCTAIGIQYCKRPKSEDLRNGFYPSASLQRSIGFEINQIMYLDRKFFEKLVITIHNEPDYSRCISILTEIYSTTPNGQSILLSVALETICEIISSKNESNVKPIKDKAISNQVICDLKAVLDNYSDKIDVGGINILRKKIENINSPTNQDKLAYPFSLYRIKLTEKEMAALQERNNVLHGRGLKDKDDSGYTEQKVCHLLRFCVSLLLAKYINYYGPFLYHSTLQELKQKKELSDYLIKII